MTNTIPALSADEAHAYLRELDDLVERLDDVNARRYSRRMDEETAKATLGDLHGKIGRCLKIAGVHADLAIAEQIRGLREDLAAGDLPIPYTLAAPADLETFEGPLAVVRAIDRTLEPQFECLGLALCDGDHHAAGCVAENRDRGVDL
jgi:hypothetical protein